MPPEHPPLLFILDTSFRDSQLVGRTQYIEAKTDKVPLSVRWGIGSPPPGYTVEGGGVVFVANQRRYLETDENASIQPKGPLSYSYEEGLEVPWGMLVMILPTGHALAKSNPTPDGSRLFGEDRLAYYWRLKPEGGPATHVKLEWSLRPTSDVGKALRGEIESSEPFPFTTDEMPEFGVFVSYRKDENKWEAGRIKDWLSRELGKHSVFRDTDSIRAGKDFRQELDAAVGKCRIMLALIGPTWLKRYKGTRRIDSENDWVRIEIESALQRHRLVIPVLLDDATMPRDTSLPESLRELAYRQAYTLRESTFERDVMGLIEQVRAHVAELKK